MRTPFTEARCPTRMLQLLLMLYLTAIASTAHAAFIQSQIHPGEKLVVTFGFTSPPISPFGLVDFINFGGGLSYTDFWTGGRSSSVTVNIYDGDALLGTKVMTSIPTSACNCIFVSPGSLGATAATVDIDMSSIINGTIDGRIEFEPVFDAPIGASVIDFSWEIKTGHYLGYGSSSLAQPAPTIYSSAVVQVVPIPSAVWLFGSALGVVGVMHRKLSS